MYELPEGKRATRGKSIMNFISLSEGERVTSILPMPKNLKDLPAGQAGNKELSLLLVTEEGTGKKVSAASFHDVRGSGIIAIKLGDGDKLVSASAVTRGDSCVVVTSKGQSIRFKEIDVREMGRTAAGVRVIKLKKGDRVIGAHPVFKDSEKTAALLTMGSNGYGKKTPIKEYKIQKRGGSGIKTGNVTAKTGEIIASAVVTGGEEEAVAMSKKSQVIRLALSEIPSLGRSTQGVRIMKLYPGDSIASFICL
jgi:DNA gyrase subunit A